jgi:hypothetical protein
VLYKLLTINITNHMSFVQSSIQFGCPFKHFMTDFFLLLGVVSPTPTPPKPEDRRLSAVRDDIFNLFAVTLHTWRPSPPFRNLGRAMHGTVLQINFKILLFYFFAHWRYRRPENFWSTFSSPVKLAI